MCCLLLIAIDKLKSAPDCKSLLPAVFHTCWLKTDTSLEQSGAGACTSGMLASANLVNLRTEHGRNLHSSTQSGKDEETVP